MYNDRDGKIGRGMVIQDIGASPSVCMDKIRDLTAYHKMVPHVKKVEIYDSQTFNNVSGLCVRWTWSDCGNRERLSAPPNSTQACLGSTSSTS